MSQYIQVKAGSQPDFMARLVKSTGEAFTRDELASISYTISLLAEDDESVGSPVAGHVAQAVDLVATVFDTPQTGQGWTEDDYGYNFRLLLPATGPTAFGLPGRSYRVVFTVTPTEVSGYAAYTVDFWVRTFPSATATAGYATRRDLDNLFGAKNIDAWADVDGERNADLIAARVATAIEYAAAEIDDLLRGGPYTMPLASTPLVLRDLAARLAGVWLYESKGVVDFDEGTGQPVHRLQYHRRHVEQVLSEVRTGARRLDLARPGLGTTGPFVSRD